ncbi:type IV pilus twitching motility protein PilT [Patescibacteria group bacterium]|nr:type IV pilus twitching motility protein PilT [Patescibacteria group bacterium]MBU1703164.1 type IV pilus twitching motility protein PilT [Patescibacteria group bacterium]MBU1954319.1 type IV pilus twitching motility protein PilT [Patescibacteria group bacterium]
MQLDKIFRTAVQYKASDIYITTGSKPVLRINGDLILIEEHEVFTKKVAEEYLLEILNEEQKKYFAKNLDLDFSLDIPSIARFRVNIFVQRKGISAAFRLIPEAVYSIDELGLPEVLKQISREKNGLVIVTGPTGSGKSTTLAAMVNEVNETSANHIITIEDPIEFVHQNKKSIIEQREVKSHTLSFERALRSALREDPDVILVGEMRDLETISLAITAAETGHLVFATLHTSGAAKSIDRMIDAFPFEQQNQIRSQLAESLTAVIWQNLVKTKDGKGRIAPLEIMINNSAIANMIRKNKTHQVDSAIETGFKEGMQTMKKSVSDLLDADLITEETALDCIPEEIEA